jgi:hypothetical protein
MTFPRQNIADMVDERRIHTALNAILEMYYYNDNIYQL